jgi:ABC-type transporter MlaC component
MHKMGRAGTAIAVTFMMLVGASAARAGRALGPRETVMQGAALLRGHAQAERFLQLVDSGEVSRRILGIHFDTLTPAQRQRMTGAVESYAGSAYQAQLPTLGSFHLTCREHRVTERFADVRCDVKRRGEVTPLTILLRKVDGWRVFDVQAPQFALIRDNAQRADAAIRREGFEGYLRRLARRVNTTGAPVVDDVEGSMQK